MIQRIQTLYLALAVIFIAAAYFTPLFDRVLEDPAAWIFSSFVAASLFSVILTIWSVFKFSNRKAQSAMVAKTMIFQVITIGIGVDVFFTIGSLSAAELGEFIGVIFLILALFLQFLGRVAIEKDEKLVKSIDRIR